MHIRLIIFIQLLLLPGCIPLPVVAGQPDLDRLILPPLAKRIVRNGSERSWQLRGRLPGAVAIARRDFQRCLARQGWILETTVSLGERRRDESSLTVWHRGTRLLYLLISPLRPGQSDFSLRLESKSESVSNNSISPRDHGNAYDRIVR